MLRHRSLSLRFLLFAAVLAWGVFQGWAQIETDGGRPAPALLPAADGQQPADAAGGRVEAQIQRMQRITPADREAAAARAREARASQQGRASAGAQPMAAGRLAPAAVPVPGGTPDYFGIYPNWAFSPPLRKFVDKLPGLGPGNANLLGQFIPVATADTVTYPGSDYYELELREYTEKMHSDLPATKLRGYVQTNNGTAAGCGGFGQPACTLANNTVVPATIHYLGPLIIAQRNRPVRIKFTNKLPTGTGGNLFIPVDTTIMGAGAGPAGTPFTQNRGTIHLHGGTTPWISDGTTHQWITPATESTPYPNGVSVYNVPDMPNPGPPGSATNPLGSGSQTFYYTNQQSARLMFYHDHASGITRLNVMAGVAAGYLLQDPTEAGLVSGGKIPADQIPLVIQDKTFVDAATIASTDPTWNWGSTPGTPHTGDLWIPHVYMPNQNPWDMSGANPVGRWDYGPWFWPPFTGLQYGPVANPYFGSVGEPPQIPGTPNPSIAPELFLDTPVVNGTAYPYLEVQPKAYRFRILNAANDRFWNLQLYQADTSVPAGCPTCAANSEVKMIPAVGAPFIPTCAPGVKPTLGTTAPLFLPSCRPPTWPTDFREGGVPDPALAGPDIIQIGTEGGFLPGPAVLPSQPVDYIYDRRNIVVLNVSSKQLFLGPAERADVIVDFSQFAGKTLILYNDSPAPVPASDPRNDYYTGKPDQSMTTGNGTGGSGTTPVGYGPNTRTIMQIRVANTTPAAAFNVTALNVALPTAFAASQEQIIVPQAAYNGVYGSATVDTAGVTVARIQDTSMRFTPLGQVTPLLFNFQPKSIIENFQFDYGRMNALLGVELPNTNITNQTSIIQTYNDPYTELVKVTDPVLSSIGSAADGTQLWKITHNGVDTHAIHFHMFVVQIVNRVGWDGAIRPPDPNELGWKDTVRMNPLEDIVVALRPIALSLPWKIPNSYRPLAPALPIGATSDFTNVDPAGLPITVTNVVANFGWEYVWHCHLLGHEENDMMRALVVAVPPEVPTGLAGIIVGTGPSRRVNLVWTDNSLTASGFTLQRASNNTFTSNLATINLGKVTSYQDNPPLASNPPWYYRVLAFNTVGSGVPGYPSMTANSAYSATATVQGVAAPLLAPSNLTAAMVTGPGVRLNWTDNSSNETGFQIQRATDAAFTANLVTYAIVAANTTTYVNGLNIVVGTTYYYRVRAVIGNPPTQTSDWSNVASIAMVPPAAPNDLLLSQAAPAGSPIVLTWVDLANNETSFRIERRIGAAGTWNFLATINVPNTQTYSNTGPTAGTIYYYRVRAQNPAGNSAWATSLPITAH
jgi:FtsP/CotA-like multicopper oxidase with cupredoxin domain